MGLFKPMHRTFAIVLSILCEINSSYSFKYSLLILCRYVPEILKICMKDYYAEKILTNLQHFEPSLFLILNCHIQQWLVVHSL